MSYRERFGSYVMLRIYVMNSGSRLVFCRTAQRTPAVQLFLVLGIWEARDCCHILHVTINMTEGWRGVGWANNVHLHLQNVGIATLLYVLLHLHTSFCYATVRSLALAHIWHATLLYVLLHLHTYFCYATVRYLALAHICHATLLHAHLQLHTYVMP